MSDIIHRLNAHASAEHDGVNCEIGFEAAERIMYLRLEIERLTKERDAAIREIGPAFAEIERLKIASSALLDRIEKFIDRRCVDDGPDWEYSKLDAAMTEMRAALKEQP
jgi:hypothetical protein